MRHAHWVSWMRGSGFLRDVCYVGAVREFDGAQPVNCVAITMNERTLHAFAEGLGADGYAQEPMRDWRDRLLEEETRDIPSPPREPS